MENWDALLQSLLQEESELQFDEFTNRTAYEVGSRIVETAMRECKSIAVSIIRNGDLIFHAKLDGTAKYNDQWIARKNNVVRHFGHSSHYMDVLFRSKGRTIDNYYLDPKQYAASGGAFPIIVKNVGIVGTIAVSGLPSEQDHEMVVSALREYLGRR